MRKVSVQFNLTVDEELNHKQIGDAITNAVQGLPAAFDKHEGGDYCLRNITSLEINNIEG